MLVVEDNPPELRLFQEVVRQAKIRCTLMIATNGEQALEAASGKGIYSGSPRPNLILLDYNMPGMDGGEVLRALKDDAYTRSIPVIMFSSSRSQADIHRAYDLHANCYIAKPFDLDGVLEVVKSIQDFWTLTTQLPK